MSRYGDDSQTHEVEFGDGVEVATHSGTRVLDVGDAVLAAWNASGNAWEIEPQDTAAAALACQFTDLARLVGFLWPIEVSPDGQWFTNVDFGGTLNINAIADGSLASSISLGGLTPNNNNDAFCFAPDGSYLAVCIAGTPWIKVYPFDTSTGTISAAVADPATLPGQNTSGAHWNAAMTYLTMGCDVVAGSPAVITYAWSAGFGAKVADPASQPAGVITSLGARFNPAGDFIVVANTGSSSTNKVFGYPFVAGAYGTLVTVDIGTAFAVPLFPRWNASGSLIAFTSGGGGTYAAGCADTYALAFAAAAFGAFSAAPPPPGVATSTGVAESGGHGDWQPAQEKWLSALPPYLFDGSYEPVAVIWEMTTPFTNPCYFRRADVQNFGDVNCQWYAPQRFVMDEWVYVATGDACVLKTEHTGA